MKKIFTLAVSIFLFSYLSQAQAPTTQASAIKVYAASTNSNTSMTLAWTRGNGAVGVVIVISNSTGNYVPPNGSTQAVAGTAFPTDGLAGVDLDGSSGGIAAVVYNNTGTSVTVTGLAPNTPYIIHAYEYNAPTVPTTAYLFSTAASNPLTFQFLTSTNATWPTPAGVNDATIQAWGGGASGGGDIQAFNGGGGGGGGAYASTTSAISGTYNIVVATTKTGTTGSGTDGGNTSFGILVVGAGGKLGNTTTSTQNDAANNGHGGAGGLFSASTPNTTPPSYSGGTGGNGRNNSTNGRGGGGGASGGIGAVGGTGGAGAGAAGTAGIATTGGGGGGLGGDKFTDGSPGSFPGGGGGGGGETNGTTNINGGNGAAGLVIISYNQPTIISATLDYGTGLLVVTFSESVAVTTDVDGTKFHLDDVSGVINGSSVTLTNAEVTSVNTGNKTVTFTLTGPHLTSALAISGVTGGNGGAVALDVDAGGAKNSTGNANAQDYNNTVTETAAPAAPLYSSANTSSTTVIHIVLSPTATAVTNANGSDFTATGVTVTGAVLNGGNVDLTVTGMTAGFSCASCLNMAAGAVSNATGSNLVANGLGITDGVTPSVSSIVPITTSSTNGIIPRTGTISVTSGTTAVTGVGTLFNSGELAVGAVIKQANGTVIGTVSAIGGDLSLTLAANAPSTITTQPYTVGLFYTVTFNEPVKASTVTIAPADFTFGGTSTGNSLGTISPAAGNSSIFIVPATLATTDGTLRLDVTTNGFSDIANNINTAGYSGGTNANIDVNGPQGSTSTPVTVANTNGKIPRTGTISVTSGTTAVVGVGTLFNSELVVGSIIKETSGTVIGTVTHITDDTNLTLAANAPSTLAGVNYVMGLYYTVTFNELTQVSSVDANDFTLTGASGGTGTIGTIYPLAGNTLTFIVNVDPLTTGTLRLDVSANGRLDVLGNSAVTTFIGGTVANIDLTGPGVSSSIPITVANTNGKIPRTGTISVTSGTTAVVGVGTLFNSELVVGSIIKETSGTVIGTVSHITDDTNLTLAANAPNTLAGVNYVMGLYYTVTFNELTQVSSVDANDFTLTGASGGTGTIGTIYPLAGNTLTFIVNVDPLTTGTLRLDVTANGRLDVLGNSAVTTFTGGTVANADFTGPDATAIAPITTSATNGIIPRTGTITTSIGSPTVTGASTQFSTELAVGAILKDATGVVLGTIQSITNNTSLTLAANATATLSTQPYAVGLFYSVTFNEPTDVTTVDANDFGFDGGNTGTGTLGTITPVLPVSGDATVFTVNVTPTASGTLKLNKTADPRLDALGNSSITTFTSGTAANVDLTAPQVVSVTAPIGNGTYGIGTSIPIVVTFSKNVFVNTAGGTPTIQLETGTTDELASYSSGSGGTALTFTYVVVTGDVSAHLDYISTTPLTLNGGTIKDAAGNAADLTTFAVPGALNSISDNQAIVIDGVPPAAATVAVASTGGATLVPSYYNGTNTGVGVTIPIISDNSLVNGTYEVWINTAASPSSPVPFKLTSATSIGATVPTSIPVSYTQATLNASGRFTNGSTSYFYVVLTDAAGNSSPVNFTPLIVDQTAPATPSTPVLLSTDDTGSSTSDGITQTNTNLHITGGNTSVENNATVTVYQGATLLGQATANGSGAYSYLDVTTYVDGTYPYTVTATDAAGNTSIASAGLSITIDNVAPTSTATYTTNYVNNGTSQSVTLTFNENLTVAPKVTVTKYDATVVVSNATMTGSNKIWSNTATTVWTGDGLETVTTGTGQDAAGNIVALTPATNTFTVDNTAPTAVTIVASGGQADPEYGNTVNYTVTFTNGPVNTSSFISGDFAKTGTATYTMGTPSTSDGGLTFSVVATVTVSGTVIPTLMLNKVTDLAGNTSGSATVNTGQTITAVLDPTNPTSITPSAGTPANSTISLAKTGGAATKYLVIARATSAVNFTPSDGATYSGISSDFSAATDQGSGNKIVGLIAAAGFPLTITGLLPGTTYQFSVFAENDLAGSDPNYAATGVTNSLATAACVYPTAPTAFSLAPIATKITVGWSRSTNVPFTLILIKQGTTAPTFVPVDGVDYSSGATLVYTSAPTHGDVNVVYTQEPNNSAGANTAQITGLTASTNYYIVVYLYDPTTFCYQLTNLGGTTSTTGPQPETTLAAGNTVEPSTFTISAASTATPGIFVFDFAVTDPGVDGSNTLISSITINQDPTNNNVTNWTQAILGAELNDGANSSFTQATTAINSSTIVFSAINTGGGKLGEILDGVTATTKTYSLKIWLNPSLGGTLPATIDGLHLAFLVNTASFAYGAASSTLVASQTLSSGATTNVVDVVASTLAFTTQPPATAVVNVPLTSQPLLTAKDAFGNSDLATITATVTTPDAAIGPNSAPASFTNGTMNFATANTFNYQNVGASHMKVTTTSPSLSATSTQSTTVTSTTTLASATVNLAPVSPSTLSNSIPDRGMFGFSLQTDGAIENLTSITIHTTVDPTTVMSNFRLYSSSSNDFSTASTLSLTGATTSSTITFSSISVPITSTIKYLYLVADVNAFFFTGTPTIQLSLASTDLTVSLAGATLTGSTTARSYSFTDNTKPTILSITNSQPLLVNENNLVQTVTVIFSEPMSSSGTPNIQMSIGGWSITPVGWSNTNFTSQPVFDTYTATETYISSTQTASVTSRVNTPANQMKDLFSNLIDVILQPLPQNSSTFILDNQKPTVSTTSISVNPLNIASNTIRVTFNYIEAMTTTSGPAVTPTAGTFGAGVPATTGGFTNGWNAGGTSYAIDFTDVTAEQNISAQFTANGAFDANGNKQTSLATSGSFVIDRVKPSVSSINLTTPSPTNSTSITFQVVFNESVMNVAAGNFTTNVIGPAVPGVITVAAVSGTTYNVTVPVDASSGNSDIRLDLSFIGSITDIYGNPLGATFSGTSSIYTVDQIAPSIFSIDRDAAMLNAWDIPDNLATPAYHGNQFDFIMTFNEPVSGVSTSLITPTGEYNTNAAFPPTGTSLSALSGSSLVSVTPVDISGNPASSPSKYWKILYNYATGTGYVYQTYVNSGSVVKDAAGNVETTATAFYGYENEAIYNYYLYLTLPEPTNSVSSATFNSIATATTSVNLQWNHPIGAQTPTNYVIRVKESALTFPGGMMPTDGQQLSDDTDASDGFLVINVNSNNYYPSLAANTNQSQLISNLKSGVSYDFEIYPYAFSPNLNFTQSIDYRTTSPGTRTIQTLTASQGTLTSIPITATISSTVTATNGIPVYSFTFNEDGAAGTKGSDNAPTKFNTIIINKGGTNNVLDWTTAIAPGGAQLTDTKGNVIVGTVNPTNITFTSLLSSPAINSDAGYIADNVNQTFTLRIWLKSTLGVADNSKLDFKVDNSSFLPYDNSRDNATAIGEASSQLAASQSVQSGTVKIDVQATQLVYTTNLPPQIGVKTVFPTPPVVEAWDANGNLDIDYIAATPFTISLSNGGMTETSSTTFIAGKLTLSNFVFNSPGATNVIVSATGTTSATSDSDNITAGNQTTIAVITALTQVTAVGGSEPATVSSLRTVDPALVAGAPQLNGVQNFQFKITDDVGATTFGDDGLPTKVSSITITQSSNNGTTNGGDAIFNVWTNSIAGAQLSDGSGQVVNANLPIPASSLVFNIGAGTSMETIGDNGFKVYTLKIWFRNSVASTLRDNIDHEDFVFDVVSSNISVAASPNSSTLQALTASSADGKNKVDVLATQLDFTTQPTASQSYDAALAPTSVVNAHDANLNTDIDWDFTTNPASITATQVPGTARTFSVASQTPATNSNGIFTFNSGMNVTSAGGGLNGDVIFLTASGTGLTSGNSSNITMHYSGNSDIIKDPTFVHAGSVGNSYTADILYKNYQSGTFGVSTTPATIGVALERFVVEDGGPSHNDTDGSPTVLQNITLNISNYQNLRTVALYNGTTIIAEKAVAGNVINVVGGVTPGATADLPFTSLAPFQANDNLDGILTVYATFIGNGATDNQVVKVQVTSVVAGGVSSSFNVGSSTSFATLTGTDNQIEVVATELDVTTPAASRFVSINTPFTPYIEARDLNANRDLDFTAASGTVTAFSNTSSVTMMNGPVVSTTQFTLGVLDFSVAFPSFQFTTGNNNDLVTFSMTAGGLTIPISPILTLKSNTITPGALPEPTIISSLATSAPGTDVFDFQINDDDFVSSGGNDSNESLPTLISQIKITQLAGNDIADWRQIIASATLTDGVAGHTLTGTVNPANGTDITFSSIDSSIGGLGYITDNTSKTYTLNIVLLSSLGGSLPSTVDNLNLAFEVLAPNISIVSPGTGSSTFSTSESENSGATNNAVDVIATKLKWTTEPLTSLLVVKDISLQLPVPIIEAMDVDNNRDLNYVTTLNVTNTEALPMLSTTTSQTTGTPPFVLTSDGASGTANGGRYTFPNDFQYGDIGTGAAGNGTMTVVPSAATTVISTPEKISTSVTVRVGIASTITAGALAEPATISSLVDLTHAPGGLKVFDFMVNDDPSGTPATENDGNPTRISSITITQGTGNTVTDWKQAFAQVQLDDGTGLPGHSGFGTITPTSIIFGSSIPNTLSTDPGYITDNGSKTFTITVWLKTNLSGTLNYQLNIDGKNFVFEVLQANVITDPHGTSIISGQNQNSGASNSKVEVITTQLDFITQPDPINISSFADLPVPQPVVHARDVNGNLDVDYFGTIATNTITNTGTTGTGSNASSSTTTELLMANIPTGARTGTITASTASTAVTGVGTSFTTELFVGSVIENAAGTVIGTVASITSNTSLTLSANAAVNVTGAAYNVALFVGGVFDFSVYNSNLQFNEDSGSEPAGADPAQTIRLKIPVTTNNQLGALPTLATSNPFKVIGSYDSWMYFDPNFTYTSQIDFVPYQTAPTTKNSQALARIILSDGGAAAGIKTNQLKGTHNDSDGAFTKLSSFTVSFTNSSDIQKIGLYTGAGVQIGTDYTPGPTVTFNTGLSSYAAPDDDTVSYVIRAAFNASIIDQHQIVMKITAATHLSGSNFPENNPTAPTATIAGVSGGAASDATQNYLNVIATSLDFLTQPSAYAGINEPIGTNPSTGQPYSFGSSAPYLNAMPTTTPGIVTARDRFANVDTGFNPAGVNLQDANGNNLVLPALPVSLKYFNSGVMSLNGMQYTVAVGNKGSIDVQTTSPNISSANPTNNTLNNAVPCTVVNVLDVTVGITTNGSSIPPIPNTNGQNLKGGFKQQNIFGLKFSAASTAGTEPQLKGFTINFDVPYQTSSSKIFSNFTLQAQYTTISGSVTSNFTASNGLSTGSSAGNSDLDQIKLTLPTPISLVNPNNSVSFFLLVDVDVTVNSATPKITPQFIDGGSGQATDQNTVLSNGTAVSVDAGNVRGAVVGGIQYSFASTKPPVLLAKKTDQTAPYAGQDNVDPNLQNILLQFDTNVGSLDLGGNGKVELWLNDYTHNASYKVANLNLNTSTVLSWVSNLTPPLNQQQQAFVNSNNTVTHVYPYLYYDISLLAGKSLQADSVYFVKMIQGNYDATANNGAGAGVGVTDFSLNLYGGISTNSTLYFKISSNQPPKLSFAGSSFNTNSLGTLTTNFDQFGTAFYLIVNSGATAPTAAEVFGQSVYGGGTVAASGSYPITSTNSKQTVSFPATFSPGTAYDVYIIAENDAVVNGVSSPVKTTGVYGGSAASPAYGAGLAGPTTTIPATGAGSIAITQTNSVPNANSFLICPDSYTTLNSPMIVGETSSINFNYGQDQNFNVLLPTGYQFDVTVAPVVQLVGTVSQPGGNFINLSNPQSVFGNSSNSKWDYKYASNTLLTISFNNSNGGLDVQDYILVSGLSVKGVSGSLQGNISWFFGTNVFALTYSNPVFSLATIALQNTTVPDFNNSYWFTNRSLFNAIEPVSNPSALPPTTNPTGDALDKTVNTIPDNYVDKNFPGQIQLLPDPRTLTDFLASTFSGSGVSGDLFTLNAVATGSAFNITMQHTDPNGCTTQTAEQYLVYDHRSAISTKLGTAYPVPSPLAGTQQAIVNTNWPNAAGAIVSPQLNDNEVAGYILKQLTVDLPSSEISNPGGQFMTGASWRNWIQNNILVTTAAPYSWDYSSTVNASGAIVNSTPHLGINTSSLGLKDVYDYFKSPVSSPNGSNFWTGGSLGKVEFTGVYNSTADASVYVPFRQNVELFVPAVPVLEVTSAAMPADKNDITKGVGGVSVETLGSSGKIYSSGYPGTSIFCEHGGNINISGFPLATAGVSGGIFGIYNYSTYDFNGVFVPGGIITTSTSSNIVSGVGTKFQTGLKVKATLFDPQGNIIGSISSIQSDTQLTLAANALQAITSSTFRINNNTPLQYAAANTDFVDAGNGTMTLNPLTVKNNYDDILVTYTYQGIVSPAYGVGYLVIRVTPNPVAKFLISSTPIAGVAGSSTFDSFCVGSPITFDAYGNGTTASAINTPSLPATPANTITNYTWDFGDNNSGSLNSYHGPATTHNFNASSIYTVSLTLISNWGCSSLASVSSVIPVRQSSNVLYSSLSSLSASIGATTGKITVGEVPTVDFSFVENCVNVPMIFTDHSGTTGSSTSGTVAKFDWDFGDGGAFTGYNLSLTIPPSSPFAYPSNPKDGMNLVAHTYTVPKFYNVTLTTTTDLGCANDSVKYISQLPSVAPSQASAFSEYFDTSDGGWLAVDIDQVNSPIPVPGYPLGIGKSSWTYDAAKGKWTIGGSYNSNEKSALYSACLDLSTIPRPVISYDAYINLASNSDGLVLQYSTDNLNIMDPKKQWEVLGTTPDASIKPRPGLDWYNSITLGSSPGTGYANSHNISGFGWNYLASKGGSIQHPKHTLDTLSGHSKVVLRFAFGSLTNAGGSTGITIDSVRIGSRTRTILFENFTSTNPGVGSPLVSGLLRDANFASQFTANNILSTQIVNVNYHVGFLGQDPFNLANPADPSARALYYNVNKVPYAFLDGKHSSNVAAGADSALFLSWGQGAYDLQTLNLAKADFTGTTVTPSTVDGSLQIDVTVTPTDSLHASTMLQIAVLEESIPASQVQSKLVTTGETQFNYVLKKLIPDATGTKFPSHTFKSGVAVNLGSYKWVTDPPFGPGNKFAVVVFLQDEITKIVYQAELFPGITPPASTVTGVEPVIENVKIYPNPADQEFTIELPSPAKQSMTLNLANQLGQFTEVGSFNEGEQTKKVSTRGLAEGVYILQLGSNNSAMRTKVVVLHK